MREVRLDIVDTIRATPAGYYLARGNAELRGGLLSLTSGFTSACARESGAGKLYGGE